MAPGPTAHREVNKNDMIDPPLFVVWPHAAAFWGAYVWVFWPELRLWHRTRSASRDQDEGTMRLMAIVGWFAGVVAVMLTFALPVARISTETGAFLSGVSLMIAGATLRRHCMSMLGARFTPCVVVTSGQAVVEKGAYRWVRHPSYTAGMMIALGYGLALGNWISVLLLVTSAVLLYMRRVYVEERAMVLVLGDAYDSYMRRTTRFIPYLV